MSVAAAVVANPLQNRVNPFARRPAPLAGLARRAVSHNYDLSVRRTVSNPHHRGTADVFAASAYDGDVQYANNVLPMEHKVRAPSCVHQVCWYSKPPPSHRILYRWQLYVSWTAAAHLNGCSTPNTVATCQHPSPASRIVAAELCCMVTRCVHGLFVAASSSSFRTTGGLRGGRQRHCWAQLCPQGSAAW